MILSIIIIILQLINLILAVYGLYFKYDKSHVDSEISTWPVVHSKKSKNKIAVNDDLKLWTKENITN